jgi:MFS family permease
MPFMNTYWTQRSTASNRGQYAALYTIAWGIGQTAGPFLCSRIAENFGFNLLFIVLGIALLFSSAGFQLLGYLTARKAGTGLTTGTL